MRPATERLRAACATDHIQNGIFEGNTCVIDTSAVDRRAGCVLEQSIVGSDCAEGWQRTVTQQELGRSFGMKIGDSIALNDLRVTFRSVEGDSRCPTDVVCVWAGDAAIAFKVDQGGKTAVAALHTLIDPRKTEWNGYTISLVGLAPTRKTTDPVNSADYRAELVITR